MVQQTKVASDFAHVACAQDWFCTRSLNQSIIEDPGWHCAERKPCSAALPPTRPQISLPLGIPGIGVAASPVTAAKLGKNTDLVTPFDEACRQSISDIARGAI
jgi:hypothetical protein